MNIVAMIINWATYHWLEQSFNLILNNHLIQRLKYQIPYFPKNESFQHRIFFYEGVEVYGTDSCHMMRSK